jgi:hypothetical protein
VTAGGRAVVVAGAVVRVGFTVAVLDTVLTAVGVGPAVRASALVAVVAAAAEGLESGTEPGWGARPQAAATTSTRTTEGITLFIGHHLSVT